MLYPTVCGVKGPHHTPDPYHTRYTIYTDTQVCIQTTYQTHTISGTYYTQTHGIHVNHTPHHIPTRFILYTNT